MANALFGGGPVRSKNLVEFKAGRMNLKGKMVHPDKRKGLVYVYQSEDSLMHFCWKDRSNGLVEDDLIIFPDDIEVKRIPQCTTGRVFLMRFKTSNKKFFFWMQETDTEKDEKHWKKVNDLLNNPGSVSSSVTSGAGGERGASSASAVGLPNVLGSDFGNIEGPELHNLIGSMSDQQLQMFLGGFMPVNSPSSNRSGGSSNLSSNQASRVQSTTTASRTEPTSVAAPSQPSSSAQTAIGEIKTETSETPKPAAAATEGAPKMQFSDFQNILGNLAKSGANGSNGATDLDLSDVLTLDVMAPILSNKDVQARLIEHLPESPDILPKNEQELRQTLTTPQFKKALSSFCMALQSGQLGPVFKQFDLPDEVANAAAQGNLEAFAKAMEAHAKQKSTTAAPKKAQDDDPMDTK